MKVINLFAGPGAGKSTTAAGLFHEMKLAGHKVELVTEFAKDLTYEKRHATLENQLYIFAKQYHKIFRLEGQVDWVITDSPIILGLMYTKPDYHASFRQLVIDIWNTYDNYNYFIGRTKEYQSYGRSQTAEQAGEIDAKCYNFLVNQDIDFTIVNGDKYAVSNIYHSLELF